VPRPAQRRGLRLTSGSGPAAPHEHVVHVGPRGLAALAGVGMHHHGRSAQGALAQVQERLREAGRDLWPSPAAMATTWSHLDGPLADDVVEALLARWSADR
jgi:hypothetical protein